MSPPVKLDGVDHETKWYMYTHAHTHTQTHIHTDIF